MTLLKLDFFSRDTLTVAQDLIGTTITVGNCVGRIVETEAYTTDAASHAVTRFNQAQIMRETFGQIYVYLIYGMYYCLNLTTDKDGPGAVLIRAVEPIGGIEDMRHRRNTDDIKKLASGPGRLSQAFGLNLSFNAKHIGHELKLRGRTFTPQISASSRIGITKATELEWRFFETDSPFVSRPKLFKSSQL